MRTWLVALSVWGCMSGYGIAQSSDPPKQRPEVLAPGAGPLDAIERLVMPAVDIARLLQEDERRTSGSLRFAYPIPVAVTPATHGTWETLGNGYSLWRVRVISKGAVSLNLGFRHYVMPAGGRLFVYTPDYRRIVGPFTDQDNKSHGELWLPIINGDDLVVEVVVPSNTREALGLELSSVGHGYRQIGR